MKRITLLGGALADVRTAMRFYDDASAGLGAEFLDEVERALRQLGQTPELGAPTRRGARRLVLRRFPFVLLYRDEREEVLVLAVGHQRRHPDFWLRRR